MSLLSTLRTKVRNAINDNGKNDSETFVWTSGDTCTIAQENVSEVTSITNGGTALESGDYSFDDSSITVTFESSSEPSANDVVVVYYTYYKYSNDDIDGYIKRALMEMDANNYHPHFDVVGTDLVPIPTPKEQSLIAMICKIIVNPEYSEYKTSTVVVRYPRTKDRDEKIRQLIVWFKRSASGISGTIDLE